MPFRWACSGHRNSQSKVSFNMNAATQNDLLNVDRYYFLLADFPHDAFVKLVVLLVTFFAPIDSLSQCFHGSIDSLLLVREQEA